MATIFGIRTGTLRIVAAAIIACIAANTANAAWIAVSNGSLLLEQSTSEPEAANVLVRYNDPNKLDLSITISGVETSTISTESGDFLKLTWPGASLDGQPGEPAVPMVRRLFMAPSETVVSLDVQTSTPITTTLSSLGLPEKMLPILPPSRDENTNIDDALANLDWNALNTKAVSSSAPVASLSKLGTMSGFTLYMVEATPVGFNMDDKQLSLTNRIELTIEFNGVPNSTALPAKFEWLDGVLLNQSSAENSKDKSANYMIIITEDFAGSTPMNQFIQAKEDAGYTVSTFTATAGMSRTVILDHIKNAWNTGNAPDFLLLVGDANSSSLVSANSIPGWNGGANTSQTDLPFACMDDGDDWFPDMAYGRFSVRTVAELQAIVDKTLYVQEGDFSDPQYVRRAAFVAGTDPNCNDESTHEWIIENHMVPNGISPARVYSRSGATTQDLADTLNSGMAMGVFYGHSTQQQWTNGPLFNPSDIDALTNGDKYPFFWFFGCSVGQYRWEGHDPCFTEKCTRVDSKGAVAAYGPSAPLYTNPGWPENVDLYKFLFNAMYDDGVYEVGKSWQLALLHFLVTWGPDNVIVRDYFEMFNLMGDPSLAVPRRQENYLVITPPFFSTTTALSDFKKAKQKQGLNVSTYVVPSGTSNSAIKAYIQDLWGTDDQPDYILLVGDTDGYTSTNDSIPHWEGTGDKGAPTDNTYVCMDGTNDWYPDIPIGRFSVETEAQLRAIVDKTVHVQGGVFSDPDYVKRGTFLANPSTYNTAEPTHDWVVANYFDPIGYQANKVYASEGGDTDDVADALNNGSLFTVYLGHSGSTRWWDPEFSQSDVNALENEGLYGLAFGWSCNTAAFTGSSECIAETWIRAADKGAAAYISASTYIYWGSVEDWLPSSIHEKSFFAAFFEDDIWHIGRAWQAGLYRFLTEYGQWDGDPTHGPQQNEAVIHNFFEEFVLFGDPALKLPQAEDFTVDASPNPIDLCCTSNGRTACLVRVIKKGNFAEDVTLNVTGFPTGSTATFHANSQKPPFNSILAIEGITSAMAGSYQLEVSATATGGRVRTADVALSIASNLPNSVTLSNPTNGQTDVSRTPTLTWLPTSEASTYGVELSLSPTFSTVTVRATVTEASYSVDTTLQSNTQYYWRVMASNGCGDSEYSPVYSFTTIEQADYFTQQFSSGFDLENTTIELAPDGSGDYYEICRSSITELPVDPAGGTAFSTNEDFSNSVTLSGGKEVEIYGNKYSTFHVGENGYITFGGSDTDWDETIAEHFNMRRISALYHDLSTPSGGTVSWKQLSDSVAITWDDVAEYNTSNSNTLQVEMCYSGKIRMSWLAVEADAGIVGISNGGGTPDDFLQSDLSESQDCTLDPGFELDTTPQSRDICVPDDAVYQINVSQILDFAEVVTLTASGVPAGATAQFANNGQVPPFTATITVSGTETCEAGSYNIHITGTATGGMERFADVQLGISTDTPSPVELTSPQNGLEDASRTPRFVWQESPGAFEYYLQVATDAQFSNVVYSRRLTQANHTIETILNSSTRYYWHVRATNDCGESDYSTAFSFTTSNMLLPTTYDMPNGQSGTYSYFDSSYDGNGDPETPLSPLSGGLGELTDGVIATQHWNQTPTPYVGWHTIDPTITFHFADSVSVGEILLHLDDSGGGGGVYPPDDITITNGTTSRVYTVTDPAGDSPFWFTCDNVNLVGDTFYVTLADHNSSGGYMMLSEVEFRGATVGACCAHGMCAVVTESQCFAKGGTYHGNGTDCYPNPCVTYHPECVVISEVVQGTESGDCPRWIEITNTGTTDFAFLEGGIIVQTEDSNDIDIDVDLTDVIIAAGQSFVVSSNVGGVCTGAYPGVYGQAPDFTTEVTFGFGDERLILTNTDDSSNLMDIYGIFGNDGTGTVWEFTDGYAYRLPAWSAGAGQDFNPVEWNLGGPGSLAGANPTELLLNNTTPGTHVYEEPCNREMMGDIDGDLDVDLDDCEMMCDCMGGPDNTTPPAECPTGMFSPADLDKDGDVDLTDFALMQAVFAS